MEFAKLIDRLQPSVLFLIDGLGALLTAVLTGGLLPTLENRFGIPSSQLYVLAAIAGLFSAYSLTCYVANPANWKPFLAAIAIANTCFCTSTLILVFFFWPNATSLAIAYFSGEALIVGGLVFLEMRMVLQKTSK
ncbi:MAG: hypothetical protein RLZZ519_1565 [Bacteroidota bacterium]